MTCPDLRSQEQSHTQYLGQGLYTHEKPTCLLHREKLTCLLHRKKPSVMDLLRVKYNVDHPPPHLHEFSYAAQHRPLGHISFVQIKVLKCGFCQLKINKEMIIQCTVLFPREAGFMYHKNYVGRAESRWRRNRTGDHFLFYKFIERTIEC